MTRHLVMLVRISNQVLNLSMRWLSWAMASRDVVISVPSSANQMLATVSVLVMG